MSIFAKDASETIHFWFQRCHGSQAKEDTKDKFRIGSELKTKELRKLRSHLKAKSFALTKISEEDHSGMISIQFSIWSVCIFYLYVIFYL